MKNLFKAFIFLPFLFFAVACDEEVVDEMEEEIEEETPEEELLTFVQAAEAENLSIFLAAVNEVEGLGQSLLEAEAITVFAPEDAAFQAVLQALEVNDLPELIDAIGGIDNLELILGLHVVPTAVFSADFEEGDQTFTTLSGLEITVNKNGNTFTITDPLGNSTELLTANIPIRNGVIHTIGAVLFSELPEPVETVQITVGNSGASAYFVTSINGNEEVTSTNQDNSTWNLTVGTRYEITVTNAGSHPFAVRNAANQLLLSMEGGGSFEDAAEVNFEASGSTFNFTLTQALANEIDNYVCIFHPSMTGNITVI